MKKIFIILVFLIMICICVREGYAEAFQSKKLNYTFEYPEYLRVRSLWMGAFKSETVSILYKKKPEQVVLMTVSEKNPSTKYALEEHYEKSPDVFNVYNLRIGKLLILGDKTHDQVEGKTRMVDFSLNAGEIIFSGRIIYLYGNDVFNLESVIDIFETIRE